MRPENERAATQAALDRLAKSGLDLTVSRAIDFHIATTDLSSARAIANAAAGQAFEVDVVQEEEGDFTVWCTITVIPTESVISAIEEQLEALAKPYGGYPDGWGTSS